MREWLVTNGLGGYASLTSQNTNTSKFHGLLITSLNPPTERWVFVSNIIDKIQINNETRLLENYKKSYYFDWELELGLWLCMVGNYVSGCSARKPDIHDDCGHPAELECFEDVDAWLEYRYTDKGKKEKTFKIRRSSHWRIFWLKWSAISGPMFPEPITPIFRIVRPNIVNAIGSSF